MNLQCHNCNLVTLLSRDITFGDPLQAD